MTVEKKRKRATAANTQMLSAVALRRKLLKQKGASSAGGSPNDTTSVRPPSPIHEPAGLAVTVKDVPAAAAPGRVRREPRAKRPAPAGPADPARPAQHSTFRPTSKNYQQQPDGTVTLALSEGERLVILGSYGILVKDGQITTAGATLRSSGKTHWVHAPHCHALPVLRCPEEAEIQLRPHPAASDLRRLERLSPTFARLWNDQHPVGGAGRKALETFQIIYDSSNGPRKTALQELITPPEWNKTIADILGAKKEKAKPLTVFVCGPKSSGKSTFSRLLANRIVTVESRGKRKSKQATSGVAFLDIDPGQPQFSTPGMLSLVHLREPILSASFCYAGVGGKELKHIVKSHAVASVSPAADPQHYIECVLDLYARYKALPPCPLVINSAGWIQGSGLDLLADLVTKLRPTHAIYMSEDGPEETVETLKAALRSVPISELPSQPSEYKSRTALHLRTMQTMSYFHLDMSASTGDYLRWDASPITSKPPLSVRYVGADRGIIALMCYDYQPPIELVAEAISGTLVSIVVVDDKAAFRGLPAGKDDDDDSMAEAPAAAAADLDGYCPDESIGMEAIGMEPGLIMRSPEGLPVLRNPDGITLDPQHSRAIGTGLIRAIDTEKGELQVLTPLPVAEMDTAIRDGGCIVLVWGRLDPPSWAYTEDLHSRAFDSATKETGGADETVESTDEDTDDDGSEKEGEGPGVTSEQSGIPWVEMLHGGQKRAVGSKVWRVRRDLGRSGSAAAN